MEKLSRRLVAKCGLMLTCGILATTGAHGQNSGGSGTREVPCTVDSIRLRIATGGDDLRGGDDNFNLAIRFGDQGFQAAANVNHGAEWANNSIHTVGIKLNQAIPLNQIKSIGLALSHVAGANLTIDESWFSPAGPLATLKMQDNWDMAGLEVTAVGHGSGATIVRHGPKRFTGSDPVLNIRANIPPNHCEIGARFGRLNPGVNNVQPMTGAGSKYGKEQLLPSSIQPTPKGGNPPLQNNRLMQHALAHTVQSGPGGGVPGGDGDAQLTLLLRRQAAVAQALRASAVRPAGANQAGTLLNGGTKQALNPQTLPPKGSPTQIGTSQTMSAQGSTPIGSTAPSATLLNPENGPTRHQAPRSPQSQMIGARAPMPTQACLAGIASVDGQKSGVWFRPVAGPEGMFVIQGCGFGTTPGEVYLSELHYASAPSRGGRAALGSPLFQDRVSFQIAANGWSDRQIVAQIDPSASGFYDTNNVTLVVKSTNGQQYQASGFNFSAAREGQLLKLLPMPPSCAQSTGYSCVPVGVSLVTVNADVVGAVKPQVESPSLALLQPGETIAVVRETLALQFPVPANPGRSFPGGTDSYQFKFAPGFQLDPHTGVQLGYASPDSSYCQTVSGVVSKSGNWSVTYTSTSSFQVSWEADDCWPSSNLTSGSSLDVLNYASISAYELQITVLGPRGVSPWPNGNQSTLATEKMQPSQLLQKQ